MATTLRDRADADVEAAANDLSNDVVLTPYEPGRGLPLFIQPNTPRLYEDPEYAIAWLDDKRPAIEKFLSSAGAVVLRGFPIDRSIHFSRVVEGYGAFEQGYAGGAADRTVIVDNVMTVNTYAAELALDIHQEMSYLSRYPKRIAFYCRMPPITGGETIICDMREASARIDPVLFRDVAKRGIRHIRNYRAPGSDPIHPVIGKYHKIWSDAFETDDPATAEAKCRELGYEVKWCEDGSLEAANTVPGIVTHPRTGEQIWFNQLAIYTHTPRSSPELYRLHEEAYQDGMPRAFVTRYGDGGEIPLELIEPISPMLRELAVAFSWSHGDVMLIDNYLVGHGRRPYTGKRDIQVALLGG